MVEHIIVETGLGKGVEEYGNMGDVSMLQVAVERLQSVFPDASIEVLTDSAKNLDRYCPRARPLDNRGRTLWFADGVLLGRFGGVVPQFIQGLLIGCKRLLRSKFPRLLEAFLVRRLGRQQRPADAESVVAFRRSMQRADMFLVCGAGGFYDGCRGWNLDILDFLEAGIQKRIPVAMLGQGFGPLSDRLVLKRAAKILPQVNYITLRGGRETLPILRSLGVDESKGETTGDEALELAYESKRDRVGYGLGINLRFAGSAGTDEGDIERIRPVLQGFARNHNVPLIPLPIAMQTHTRDDLAIKKLLLGLDDQSDGGRTLDTPLKVIEQAALCRVVVTGAYHAAVFALAQGIPVVALARSAYFANKLLGLEDQFGEGCQTLLLNDPALSQNLRAAIEKSWQNADQLREPLLETTLRQIRASRRFYGQIADQARSTSTT